MVVMSVSPLQMNYARFFYAEYFRDLHGTAVHIDNDCIVQGKYADVAGSCKTLASSVGG